MNYVSNQNEKVQKETLAGDSNSDAVKTILRIYIISKIYSHSSVTLSH